MVGLRGEVPPVTPKTSPPQSVLQAGSGDVGRMQQGGGRRRFDAVPPPSFLLAILVAAAPAADRRAATLDAMSEELARSQAQLKLGEHPPPYFLSYQVKDLDQRLVVGRYGALFESDAARERRIFADVRVGQLRAGQLAAGEPGARLRDGGPLVRAEQGGTARGRCARAADRALADHRRALQGRALRLPEAQGAGGLRARRSGSSAVVLAGEARALEPGAGGLPVRPGPLGARGARARCSLPATSAALRFRDPDHGGSRAALLRLHRGESTPHRVGHLRRPPQRRHPRGRRAVAGHVPRLLRAERGPASEPAKSSGRPRTR